jgi:hypothetical protein
MDKSPDFRKFAYAVIILGVTFNFAIAVVPNDQVGYELNMITLAFGLMPYVVYGSFLDVVRGWLLALAGAAILAVDLLVKIPERYLDYRAFHDHLVLYAPLLSTLILLPILLGIGVRIEKRW